jgi:hypothetical protein
MSVIGNYNLQSWFRRLIGPQGGGLPSSARRRVPQPLAPVNCPAIPLEGFDDVLVLQPGLDFYVDLMRRRQGFAFVKRTHGFWDGLVFLCDSVPELGECIAQGRKVSVGMVRRALGDADVLNSVEEKCKIGIAGGANFVNHFRGHFYTELVADLQNPLRIPGYIEANSFEGYPNSHNSLNPCGKLRAVYHCFQTSGRLAHDALVWKQAIFDGTFVRVVEAIAGLPVVLIGPAHLGVLEEHLRLRQFHHVEIPLVGAPGGRFRILRDAQEVLDSAARKGRPAVVLYQAGALAFWLIYRLFGTNPRTIHLDLGRCLDVWCPEVVRSQPWFAENSQRIIENMNLQSLFLEYI